MSAPSWARPGVEVVCIDDNWPTEDVWLPDRVPMIGEVLIIDHVSPFNPVFLAFVGLPLSVWVDGKEIICRYHFSCFKPLVKNPVSQAEDVAMFRKIAKDAPEPVS